MARLVAKEKFYYAGRNVEAGEEFEAIDQDVALLTNSVSPRARLPDKPVAPQVELQRTAPHQTEMQSRSLLPAEDQKTEQPDTISRRRYTRRDMRVED